MEIIFIHSKHKDYANEQFESYHLMEQITGNCLYSENKYLKQCNGFIIIDLQKFFKKYSLLKFKQKIMMLFSFIYKQITKRGFNKVYYLYDEEHIEIINNCYKHIDFDIILEYFDTNEITKFIGSYKIRQIS